MKILSTNVYVGPNQYAHFPVIRHQVDIGALEAVVRWGQHLSELGDGSGANFAWGWILAAHNHLGRFESSLGLINEVPDSVLKPEFKDLQRKRVAYFSALQGSMDDPETVNLLGQLDSFCDQFEQKQAAQVDFVLTGDMATIATGCFIVSARTGTDRSRLGDAVLQYFNQREPFKPSAPGALYKVDMGKMNLIYPLARMGKLDEAVAVLQELYDQGFSRPYHFRTNAVVPDLEGICQGLCNHPRFLKIYDGLETRNSAYRKEIEENAPWLFDPELSSPFFDAWEQETTHAASTDEQD